VTSRRSRFRPKEVFENKVRRQSCLFSTAVSAAADTNFLCWTKPSADMPQVTLQIYLYSTSSDTSFRGKIPVYGQEGFGHSVELLISFKIPFIHPTPQIAKPCTVFFGISCVLDDPPNNEYVMCAISAIENYRGPPHRVHCD
jgi:hypothetical protein